MPFTDYIATLQELLATTLFVTATSLSYKERPPSAGLIKGWLVFADGSQLDFKEFLFITMEMTFWLPQAEAELARVA
jgi:hypothetical protein